MNHYHHLIKKNHLKLKNHHEKNQEEEDQVKQSREINININKTIKIFSCMTVKINVPINIFSCCLHFCFLCNECSHIMLQLLSFNFKISNNIWFRLVFFTNIRAQHSKALYTKKLFSENSNFVLLCLSPHPLAPSLSLNSLSIITVHHFNYNKFRISTKTYIINWKDWRVNKLVMTEMLPIFQHNLAENLEAEESDTSFRTLVEAQRWAAKELINQKIEKINLTFGKGWVQHELRNLLGNPTIPLYVLSLIIKYSKTISYIEEPAAADGCCDKCFINHDNYIIFISVFCLYLFFYLEGFNNVLQYHY